uniref:Ovule protein n=1 Tax=Steinernema glaseri TaxID=37863 RepID=A0A1I7YWQ6_9BILA
MRREELCPRVATRRASTLIQTQQAGRSYNCQFEKASSIGTNLLWQPQIRLLENKVSEYGFPCFTNDYYSMVSKGINKI